MPDAQGKVHAMQVNINARVALTGFIANQVQLCSRPAPRLVVWVVWVVVWLSVPMNCLVSSTQTDVTRRTSPNLYLR